MAGDTSEPRAEVPEVVLSLGEQDRGASVLERPDHIIEDELVALLVGRECGIQLLDPRRLLARGLESRLANYEPVSKGTLRRLALGIDDKANRAELHLGNRMMPSRRCGVAVRPTT